jgi:hypothetical protein
MEMRSRLLGHRIGRMGVTVKELEEEEERQVKSA